MTLTVQTQVQQESKSSINKLAYLKWGWIDLLGSLPALPILRIFRIARLVRIGRTMRQIGIKEVWHVYKERRSESALWTTILATIILLSASSVLIVAVEAQSPDSAFFDVGDGMWWSFEGNHRWIWR